MFRGCIFPLTVSALLRCKSASAFRGWRETRSSPKVPDWGMAEFQVHLAATLLPGDEPVFHRLDEKLRT